jgi:hypothetical protein
VLLAIADRPYDDQTSDSRLVCEICAGKTNESAAILLAPCTGFRAGRDGIRAILLEREHRYVRRIRSVSSACADIEVVIERLIQFSLLGIEFRLASLFGLNCGGPRQETKCPRLHLYYRRIVQYGSSRIDQRMGKNLARRYGRGQQHGRCKSFE